MDKSAFKKLFDDHYRPLCNFAFRITADMAKSEDVVQDVFVKIWNQQNLLQSNQNIRSFIYTMVRNHALEVIRRDGIGMKVTQHMLYLHSEETDQAVLDEEIEKYALIDKIYVSIRQLPPKCGEVFTLSKINGLSYSQIGEQLNISVKTVENHMSKALKLLREMLADQMSYFVFMIGWFF